MSPNPFSGDNFTPPKYTPKTHVDPQTGKIYELDPSGYFWNEAGQNIPNPKEHQPPKTQPVPQAFIDHVKSLNDFSTDTLKMKSAISVSITNANYNAGLFDRYVSAWLAWAQSGRRTKEPHSPKSYYRIADFGTLLSLIMADVDTSALNPPEPPAYNQN